MDVLPWAAALGGDDRAGFLADLASAAAAAEAMRDLAPVEQCLQAWHATARALADPGVREVLAGPGSNDYAEVPRPGEA